MPLFLFKHETYGKMVLDLAVLPNALKELTSSVLRSSKVWRFCISSASCKSMSRGVFFSLDICTGRRVKGVLPLVRSGMGCVSVSRDRDAITGEFESYETRGQSVAAAECQ